MRLHLSMQGESIRMLVQLVLPVLQYCSPMVLHMIGKDHHSSTHSLSHLLTFLTVLRVARPRMIMQMVQAVLILALLPLRLALRSMPHLLKIRSLHCSAKTFHPAAPRTRTYPPTLLRVLQCEHLVSP